MDAVEEARLPTTLSANKETTVGGTRVKGGRNIFEGGTVTTKRITITGGRAKNILYVVAKHDGGGEYGCCIGMESFMWEAACSRRELIDALFVLTANHYITKGDGLSRFGTSCYYFNDLMLETLPRANPKIEERKQRKQRRPKERLPSTYVDPKTGGVSI
jgi:hypothetical protein